MARTCSLLNTCPCSLISTTLAPGMFPGRPGERGPCPLDPCPSFDLARRYLRTSSKAKRLLTVERAASFMAVAFATISACVLLLAVLKDGTMGVLTMEAQLPFPAL